MNSTTGSFDYGMVKIEEFQVGDRVEMDPLATEIYQFGIVTQVEDSRRKIDNWYFGNRSYTVLFSGCEVKCYGAVLRKWDPHGYV